MALYKYSQYLSVSTHAAFDALHMPGTITPFSGIYRCDVCGHEMTSAQGHPFPPQNHHQHIVSQGAIRWRMIVISQANP